MPILPDSSAGLKTDAVAEGHFHHSLANAVFHRPGGFYLTGKVQIVEQFPRLLLAFGCFVRGSKEIDGIACFLKFGRQNLLFADGGNGKGNQRGGYIHIQECTGHRVLTANGCCAVIKLRVQCAQKRCKGLTPTGGLISELFEELLQCQVGFLIIRAGSNQLCQRCCYRSIGTLKGINAHIIRVHTPSHNTALRGFLIGQHRQHGCHRLSGRCLGLAAKGHQDRACADTAVKTLHKASATGCFQVACHFTQGAVQRLTQNGQVLLGNIHAGMLAGAIGIQESAGEICNGLSLPGHHHSLLPSDNSHAVGLQILLLGSGDKGIRVLGIHHNSHTLLGLGNGNFRTVQAVILFPNCIQINSQTGGKLTNGNGHTAGAKVIAALNEAGNFAVAEQALNLSFLGSVALLNLGCHCGQRFHIMALGRAGSATDTVTAGTATQQNNHITGRRTFSADIIGGSGSHHRATFQALGGITVMVP